MTPGKTIILDARANRTQNVGLSEQFGVYISIDDIGAGCGGAIRDIQLGSAVVYSRVGGPTAQCKAEYKVPSGSKGESFALRYCAAGRQKGVYYAYEWVEGSPPADASTEPELIRKPEIKVSKTKRILATATREPLEISSNLGTTWTTIPVGQPIEISVQDMIRTGKQSRAEIVFPDGTVFRLKSNTIMTLVAGGVKVQVGEAWFNLRKQGKRFRVVTPTTACGPLGTSGIVTYTQDG